MPEFRRFQALYSPSAPSLQPARCRRWLLTLILVWTALASNAQAQQAVPGQSLALQPAAEAEIWLVTYGPGPLAWERFGHNALWVRDPDLGLDHVFNYGFFDFAQENFFSRFLLGRMLYFAAARAARTEFSEYINAGRSIRAQRLNLGSLSKLAMTEALLHDIRPENRDYLYHYYRDNCSTRIRDVIDAALNGSLHAEGEAQAASLNWRQHTRRLVSEDFWLYLGLELVLGAPIDEPMNKWQELFLPDQLAEAVAVAQVQAGTALVLEDLMLAESAWPSPPQFPPMVWPRYLAVSLGLLLVVGLILRWRASRLRPADAAAAHNKPALGLARAWMVLTGLAGCAMVFFWVFTDHDVAANNLNLLVFSPLWLLPGIWSRMARPGGVLLVLFSLLAVLMTLLPPAQYTADVLAAFVPLNLAAAWVLWAGKPAV